MMSYLNQVASSGVALVSALPDVSLSLQIGWLVLFAWIVLQAMSLRWLRVQAPIVAAPAKRKTVKRPRAPRKKAASSPAENAADLISAVGMSSGPLASSADTYR